MWLILMMVCLVVGAFSCSAVVLYIKSDRRPKRLKDKDTPGFKCVAAVGFEDDDKPGMW